MYRIGIDLGGTNVALGLTEDDGTLICKHSFPTGRDLSAEDLTKEMAKGVLDFLKSKNIPEDQVRSIGIGCPGACDNKKGVLVYTTNLPFWKTPVRDIFAEYTKIPVNLANDANCAALGEALCGSAKGYNDSITITLGTGVGSGIILNGKMYTGSNGVAGEIGHMVIKLGGEPCTCGRKGCFESYSSATALIRDTKRAAVKYPDSKINEICGGDLSKINGKTAWDAMRSGDKVGKNVVRKYIKTLGDGLVNIINIFQPDIVLIGGGISKEGDNLLKPLRRYVFRYVYGAKFVKRTKIECAKLGNDAGIIGAAML